MKSKKKDADGEISIEQVEFFIQAVQFMESGATKIALAEEAVRMADLTKEMRLQYWAREIAVEATTFGGQPDLALIHFSWLVAQHDAYPERFEESSLLWKYKWIPERMAAFPHIPKAKIQQALADMERRFQAHGEGMHAVHHKRRSIALDLGDIVEAKKEHALMMKAQRDSLSDCEACVPNAHFDYYMAIGKPALALKTVKPILDGQLKCAEVPHSTFAQVLLPLLMQGQAEEAMQYHRKGYKLVQRNPGLIKFAGYHMSFLALTGNLPRSVNLLQKHLPVALVHVDQADRFAFLKQVWIVLDRLIAAGKSKITLRLPEDSPLFNSDGKYDALELKNQIEEILKKTAEQYDTRNENIFFSKQLKKLPKVAKYATVVPYKA